MRNPNDYDTDWERGRSRMDRESRYMSGRQGEYGRNPDYPRDTPPWQTGTSEYEWAAHSRDYDPYRRYGYSGYRPEPNYDREDLRREFEYYPDGRQQRSQLRCRDIMTTDVTTTTPEANLYDVARMMKDEDVGAIPVMEDGKLKGIVTDRDIIVRGLADKDNNFQSLSVRDVMTDDVYTVRPHDRLVDAIRKMGNKQVRRILVADSGDKLRGIISMADVALEANQDMELAQAVEDISEHKSWFGKLFSW